MPFRCFLHFCSWFPSFILRIGSVHSEFREFRTVTASSIQDVSLLLTVLLTRAQVASELGSSHVGTSRPSIFPFIPTHRDRDKPLLCCWGTWVSLSGQSLGLNLRGSVTLGPFSRALDGNGFVLVISVTLPTLSSEPLEQTQPAHGKGFPTRHALISFHILRFAF